MDPEIGPEESKLDLSASGIWQKMPNESIFAYAAFTAYIELGADCSLQKVAAKIGRSYASVAMLSSRHDWLERAAAWRQHLSNTSFSGIKKTVTANRELWATRNQTLRQQEWERSQKLGMLCNEAMSSLLSDPETKVSPYELAPLLRLASQTAHQAVTPPEEQDEIPDINKDPIILEFRAHAEKATEDQRKRDAESAAQLEAPTSAAPSDPSHVSSHGSTV